MGTPEAQEAAIPPQQHEFLLAMYKAMWENINRHITVLWQAVGVLGGAFAAALLLRKDGIAYATDAGADIGAAFVILGASWVVAHAFDAGMWFNRNIQIIGNIEKIYYGSLDRSYWPHPYGDREWRRENKLMRHIVIQFALSAAVELFTFAAHFFLRVWPTLAPTNSFDLLRSLPSCSMLIGGCFCGWACWSARSEFEIFQSELKAMQTKEPLAAADSQTTGMSARG